MQHLTDYYILYLLLICRIFLKYGTGNVMNNKHQHKRALALTSRKFVRLVYGLLARNQLYSGVSLDTSIKESE